ncbi:MAG TPA: hypothetical protein VJT73_15260 [Polyangiaceae bacterium]|nr:hypothetical protein [Polyangiaceae bacterium]
MLRWICIVAERGVRLALLLWLSLTVFLLSGDARAVGGILASGGDPTSASEVLYAIAVSAGQTTRWASLSIAEPVRAVAWLIPVRPGARVVETADAWFEALDEATAPRVMAPACPSGTSEREVRVFRAWREGAREGALDAAALSDVPTLRAFAATWGFEVMPELAERFQTLVDRGYVAVAFVYGSLGGASTRTVRITDDAFPSVPLFMTLGAKAPVRVTGFAIGERRARLGHGPELEVDPRRLSMSSSGAIDYAGTRDALLLPAAGDNWVVEAASHGVLFEGGRAAGFMPAPSVASTYLSRVCGVKVPVTPSSALGCEGFDDLGLALASLRPGAAWLTRFSGIVAPQRFGDDVAVTLTDEQETSAFVVATGANATCPSPPAVNEPGRPDVVIGGGQPRGPTPIAPDPPPGESGGTVVIINDGARHGAHEPAVTTQSSFSCSGSPSPEREPTEESDDGCSRSDSGAESSDDGCSSSSSDGAESSDDGCSSSSSDGTESSDDGCSSDSGGSDSSGDDACSRSSTDDSSSSDACSAARRPKNRARSRTSMVTLAIAAVLLPLRRMTKRVARPRSPN